MNRKWSIAFKSAAVVAVLMMVTAQANAGLLDSPIKITPHGIEVHDPVTGGGGKVDLSNPANPRVSVVPPAALPSPKQAVDDTISVTKKSAKHWSMWQRNRSHGQSI
ncbi:hypothetical protein [Mesorhizobium australicum]|uniref:hypothetical protein n=1 Tax=Mesorhizobium australicum TaxID=536018 RepID=UPI00333B32D2